MSWSVEVPRLKLLRKVRENQKKHKELVSKALDKYREAVISVLDDRIKDIKAGGVINTHVRLPVPEDHTSDYDTIIGMLALSTTPTVTLGPVEYRSYYEDKWDWTERFATTNASYGIR